MKNLTVQTISFLNLGRTTWTKNKFRTDNNIWHWVQCRTWGKSQWHSTTEYYICFFLFLSFSSCSSTLYSRVLKLSLEGPVKTDCWVMFPVSDSVSLRWSLRICISNNFSRDAVTTGLETILFESHL